MTRELVGHTTPATAYVVADYPYERGTRSEMRYWVEGARAQRLCSQLRNQHLAGRWHAMHRSRYAAVIALLVVPSGHVEHARLELHAAETTVDRFVAAYPVTSALPRNVRMMQYLRAHARARGRMTWTLPPGADLAALREAGTAQAKRFLALLREELERLRGPKKGGLF